MSDQHSDAVVERFQPTSGRLSGILGLVTAAVILVLAVAAGDADRPLGVAIIAALGGLLVWAALLRPALWVTDRDLVLRGMFRTDRIPLAAIDRVVVAQVLAVTAGGRRFVSPTIGYTARQTARANARRPESPSAKVPSSVDTHQGFVEERLNHLAQDARDRQGIARGSSEQQALAAGVRRSYAWPELAGVAACLVAFLIWLAL
jgi:hypothetical protein